MSQATGAPPKFRTIAELLHRLGDIPPGRVRLRPTPGEATERDLLKPDGRLCELVEGVLMEKAMGYKRHRLGEVTGADGAMRLMPGLVRIPDIAFISRRNLPRKGEPRHPIPDLAPDLAVEILSKANTKAEMKRKLREYFEAGVRLVWLIDPRTRPALVHTSTKASTKLVEGQSLDGGDVLPGFAVPLAELFECLDRGRDD